MNKELDEALEDLEQLAEMADNCWVSCDVHKWKNTIKQALLKAQENSKYEQLEEQIGCPLEVRGKVTYDSYVYDEDGCAYTEIIIYKDYILAYDGSEDVNGMLEPTKFYWKDYKKTWFLRKDKSE